MNEITLFGFNNLTKNLSFSLYKMHYHTHHTESYNKHIKELYSADKLNTFLTTICHAIGGNVLNIAKQDYQPQGASVTLMISEESQAEPIPDINSIVAHLDKSHLCIHTYPEESPQNNISIFRADIELSTCGVISPLKVINYIIKSFDADVIDIDYRIRGMTRDRQGKKLFNIDKVSNIEEFLSPEITKNYSINENNFHRQNLFHATLRRKTVLLKNHTVESNKSSLTKSEQQSITSSLEIEMQQLFTKIN